MRILAALAPVFVVACGQTERVELAPPIIETHLALAFDSVPTTAIVGQPIGRVSLRVVNQDGMLVVSPSITVAITARREGEALDFKLGDAVSSAGRIILETISLPAVGTLRLSASSASADPATSDPIIVSPAVASLSFLTQPTDTVASEAIAPAVEVELVDANDDRAPAEGVIIELEWFQHGIPTSDPPVRAPTEAGVARFENLRGSMIGDGYTLSARASGVGSRRSRTFSLLPEPAASLRWVVAPSASAVAEQTMTTFSVELIDRTGQRAAESDAEVIVEVVSGSVQLRGTTAVRAFRGIATFSDLSYPIAEQIRIACTSAETGILISDPIFVRSPPVDPIRAGGETAAEPFSGWDPSLSFDGRKLAFVCGGCVTPSGDMVTSPRVIDFDQGTNRALDTTPSGAPPDNWDLDPLLTRDGTKIAFNTGSTNYVTNDVNGFGSDAFTRDLTTLDAELIGIDPQGAMCTRGSYVTRGAISDDGNFVAFASDAPVPSGNGAFNGIYLRDRAAATTYLVVDAGWSQNQSNTTAALSADGTKLLFDGPATGLTADDQNGLNDVFVADLATGSVVRVSVPIPNVRGDGPSSWAQFSGDARFVVFVSEGGNLVTGDTNNVADIFVADLQQSTMERVSVSSSGTQASDTLSMAPNFWLTGSTLPGISDDGRFVAFLSAADNLVDGDTNEVADVFVHDRLSKQTVRVNISVDGVQGNDAATDLTISGDGGTIAFVTYASNVVAGDQNSNVDVYVVENPLR